MTLDELIDKYQGQLNRANEAVRRHWEEDPVLFAVDSANGIYWSLKKAALETVLEDLWDLRNSPSVEVAPKDQPEDPEVPLARADAELRLGRAYENYEHALRTGDSEMQAVAQRAIKVAKSDIAYATAISPEAAFQLKKEIADLRLRLEERELETESLPVWHAVTPSRVRELLKEMDRESGPIPQEVQEEVDSWEWPPVEQYTKVLDSMQERVDSAYGLPGGRQFNEPFTEIDIINAVRDIDATDTVFVTVKDLLEEMGYNYNTFVYWDEFSKKVNSLISRRLIKWNATNGYRPDAITRRPKNNPETQVMSAKEQFEEAIKAANLTYEFNPTLRILVHPELAYGYATIIAATEEEAYQRGLVFLNTYLPKPKIRSVTKDMDEKGQA